MEFKDYYKTLGVPKTASQAEIKKAFRKLARQHHPDVKPGDTAAERRFKEINEANEVLSDLQKRRQYDTLGADWEAYARAGGRAGASDPFGPGGPFSTFRRAPADGGVRYEFHTVGADDAGFSDFFRMFFGEAQPGASGPAGSPSAQRRAGGGAGPGRATSHTSTSIEDLLAGLHMDDLADGGSMRATGRTPEGFGGGATGSLEAQAELTLEEAFRGATRLVQVDGRRLEVKIPAGVDTGSRIRLRGRGGGSSEDGRDLYIVTRVLPHPVFKRSGANLSRELPVTLREALLGAEVPVATLKGRVLLTIPAGTQNGRTFRLAGQGMPRLKGTGAGDLLVKINVALPTDLSPEARHAAEVFLDLVDQPDPRRRG